MRLIKHSIPCVIIGSTAARHWWPSFRDPRDVDVYCFDDELSIKLRSSGFDVQRATLNNGILGFVLAAQYCPVIECRGLMLPVASPSLLRAIKCVHINYPLKWSRNIKDYIVLSRLVDDIDEALLLDRFRYLDKITKIKRHLSVADSFWQCDFISKAEMLSQHDLKSWCIYGVDYKLRRFVQDNYLRLWAINEKDRG